MSGKNSNYYYRRFKEDKATGRKSAGYHYYKYKTEKESENESDSTLIIKGLILVGSLIYLGGKLLYDHIAKK